MLLSDVISSTSFLICLQHRRMEGEETGAASHLRCNGKPCKLVPATDRLTRLTDHYFHLYTHTSCMAYNLEGQAQDCTWRMYRISKSSAEIQVKDSDFCFWEILFRTTLIDCSSRFLRPIVTVRFYAASSGWNYDGCSRGDIVELVNSFCALMWPSLNLMYIIFTVKRWGTGKTHLLQKIPATANLLLKAKLYSLQILLPLKG